jgi:hypothetical protein
MLPVDKPILIEVQRKDMRKQNVLNIKDT